MPSRLGEGARIGTSKGGSAFVDSREQTRERGASERGQLSEPPRAVASWLEPGEADQYQIS
jgi:hypothetical protein